MATKNFTDFDLRTIPLSGDYLVGYKADGSEELKTTVNSLLESRIQKSTTSYIVVEVGDDLATKYAEATTLTPNGSALSLTNRARLIVMPGDYNLSSELIVDTEFVDIIGLGSQKLEKGSIPAVVLNNNTLNILANDVRIQGISVGSQQFKIGDNLPLQIFEDCVGGPLSFNGISPGSIPPGVGVVAGTFINCSAGFSSFGTYGTASGTFTNCSATGSSSFGITASGTFTNCSATGNNNFGITASGTFTNCSTTGNTSFGGTTASGTFTNCSTTGNTSFGGTTASGTFTNCSATGNNNFGGTASGTFTNCSATGNNNFGTTASGIFKYCSNSGSGFGVGLFGVGSASGIFENCYTGEGFGSSSITGKLYQCRKQNGTFTIPTSAGLIRNCIDGNNNIVNA